jgi:hypothetical protein
MSRGSIPTCSTVPKIRREALPKALLRLRGRDRGTLSAGPAVQLPRCCAPWRAPGRAPRRGCCARPRARRSMPGSASWCRKWRWASARAGECGSGVMQLVDSRDRPAADHRPLPEPEPGPRCAGRGGGGALPRRAIRAALAGGRWRPRPSPSSRQPWPRCARAARGDADRVHADGRQGASSTGCACRAAQRAPRWHRRGAGRGRDHPARRGGAADRAARAQRAAAPPGRPRCRPRRDLAAASPPAPARPRAGSCSPPPPRRPPPRAASPASWCAAKPARGHPRHARRRGRADRARRHDQPRGGDRARAGPALRRGRGGHAAFTSPKAADRRWPQVFTRAT